MARRYNRKHLVIITFLVLMGLLIFGTPVMAADPTASIVVTVNDDFKALNMIDVSSGIMVVDPTGRSLVQNTDFTFVEDHTNGKYTIDGLTLKGDYLVTLGAGNDTQTIKVAGIKPGAAVKTATMVWSDLTGANAGKAGAIGGTVVNNLGVNILNAVIKVSNTTTSWTTKTAVTGF